MVAVLRSLIADTFRQSLASGIFWLMLAVSGLCILFCLSISFSADVPLDRVAAGVDFLPKGDPDLEKLKQKPAEERPDVIGGKVRYAFGLVEVDVSRDRKETVHFILAVLAGGVAGAAGILLSLIWTAGFLPSFLEPSAASVLLAKPVPRWLLLLGKTLGLVVFVAAQASIFVLGTWLAIGIRTGVWIPHYLWCIPLLVLHFFIYVSVSVLLAVLSRSTVVCVFGSILFWLMTWGMNYGRHAMVALPELSAGASTRMVNLGYWLLPKPVDLGYLFFRALEANKYFIEALDFDKLTEKGDLWPTASVLSSVAFALFILGLAVYQFEQTDY